MRQESAQLRSEDIETQTKMQNDFSELLTEKNDIQENDAQKDMKIKGLM
tara:strand:- start:73 stop:219 length:147 start_codon:yes stop_codon:yes gene_type:complete